MLFYFRFFVFDDNDTDQRWASQPFFDPSEVKSFVKKLKSSQVKSLIKKNVLMSSQVRSLIKKKRFDVKSSQVIDSK